MKTIIAYLYYNIMYFIDISDNENILSLLKSDIYTDKYIYYTHPNDESDNKIRKYVDEILKQQSFYKGAGHAEKIIIYKSSDDGKYTDKLHVIHGSFSDENIQELIKKIKEEKSV